MANISDAKRDALLTALVLTEGNIDDLEQTFLEGKIGFSDQINDMWRAYFLLTTAVTITGTVSVTADTKAVVGIGTLFLTELAIGDTVKIGNELHQVADITDNLNLTLAANHRAGASGVAIAATGSPNWNDAAYNFLVQKGATPGHIMDMWFEYWTTLTP